MAPSDPAACVDDSNDSSSFAYPGGLERCDGVDNDCDGVIDNGALFSGSDRAAILLSGAAQQGSPGGLTFSETAGEYGAVFTQRLGSSQNTFMSLAPGQSEPGVAVPITAVNSDTFAGPIVGRANVYATAWEDRRDDDYEIYFNRLNTSGEKLGPDVRVTRAAGFSLRPSLVELASSTGRQYRLVWEDERDGGGRIYGQRLTGAGELSGDNLPLTPAGLDPSSPALVAGRERLGVLFNWAAPEGRGLAFQSFDFDFGSPTDVVVLEAQNPDAASIALNADTFVVAWHVVQADSTPGPQIWGSIISERGDVIVAPKPLTEPAEYARYHSLLPMGDRVILLWSEWQGAHYGIHSRELSPSLEPLGAARPITPPETEGYAPLAAFGPAGEIGILYTGRREQSRNPDVFFTSLTCEAGSDFSLPR
jgi:hypothetical protein